MMRVFIEGGVCVGRMMGYEVEAISGDQVLLRISVKSDNASVLQIAEAVIAHTCSCERVRGLTTTPDRRYPPPEGCPVHPAETDEGKGEDGG